MGIHFADAGGGTVAALTVSPGCGRGICAGSGPACLLGGESSFPRLTLSRGLGRRVGVALRAAAEAQPQICSSGLTMSL